MVLDVQKLALALDQNTAPSSLDDQILSKKDEIRAALDRNESYTLVYGGSEFVIKKEAV